MTDRPQRIDGWKMIAAHFRRDRSTVMRWAQEGDFPVRRVAGKKSASVYAYAHELDAWLVGQGTTDLLPSSEGDKVIAPLALVRRRSINRAIALTTVAALLACGAGGMFLRSHQETLPPARTRSLPSDPALADLYLQARDDWSTRTPTGLHKAISELGIVTSRDPAFAPGYAGLADAHILTIEHDATPRAIAFPKAEAAAKAALAIDPMSADANRAMAFVEFWDHHDFSAARSYFNRSLRSEPDSAQTHYWLGNILADIREDEAGLDELRIARRLDPGSRTIQSDYDLALWSLGPGDPGLPELEELASHGPPLNTVYVYLSYIGLAKNDAAAFLAARERLAAIEENKPLTIRVKAERAAFAKGGQLGLLSMIATAPPVPGDLVSTRAEWPATAAALSGRRDRLLALLKQGEVAGDCWTTWRQGQARFAMWRDDPAVMAGLDKVCALRSSRATLPR